MKKYLRNPRKKPLYDASQKTQKEDEAKKLKKKSSKK